MEGNGIITGYEDGSFRPKEELTRGESMTLMVKAFGEVPVTPEVHQIQAEAVEGGFRLINGETGEALRRSQFVGGLIPVDGNLYLVGFDGLAQSDYHTEGRKIYYINGEKGLARGWKQVGDKLHYFSPVDYRMYKNGIFSTGEGAYWFDAEGRVREGNRPGGRKGAKRYWALPPAEELTNKWLEGEDQELRFRGQEIANFAAAHEGLPFKWYGVDLTNGKGVYCCGNVYSAYKEFGIHVPGPEDCDMYAHKGYEMVRAQYEAAEKFGGFRYPADFSLAWPGDLIYNYSPRFYLGYNHTGIFMGHNNGRPIYIHATLQNGLMAEDANIMNKVSGRKFNKEFVRYNTYANPGNGIIPEVDNR